MMREQIETLLKTVRDDIEAGSTPRYISHIQQHVDNLRAADVECNLLRQLQ